MTSTFRLDRVEHRYWLGEEELPSLTKIIAPLNDFDNVSPVTLSKRAQEGRDIHDTVKLWLDGTLDESLLGEGNLIALDLTKQFLEKQEGHLGDLIEYETPTYHPTLFYGTTPDWVFPNDIIEIKTRPYNKYRDPVQLIAQAHCFPNPKKYRLWVLSLNITKKTSTVQRAEHKQSWGIFRKLLDKYRMDEEIEKLIKNWKRQ